MTMQRGTAPHVTEAPSADTRVTIGLDEAGDTPILREYRRVKELHSTAMVLVRLGDFYELFGVDAERAAPLLGLTLTGRGFGAAGRLPMCGMPHHSSSDYVRKLLGSGYTVVVWEQVGEITPGKLVERQVTRVITPGTAVDEQFMTPERTMRCVALLPMGDAVGVAALDASTGEMELVDVRGGVESQALADECSRLDVAELLVPDDVTLPAALAPHVTRTLLARSLFDVTGASERLRRTTGTATLRGFELDSVPVAMGAAGALLGYCERSHIQLHAGFLRIAVRRASETMRLDQQTRRNLELFDAVGSGRSLVDVLDRTKTAMGARLLRTYLQEPLIDADSIAVRQSAVHALVSDRPGRARIQALLREARDLARLVGRCVQGIATPRDLAGIRDTCTTLPLCKAAVVAYGRISPLLQEVGDQCRAPQEVVDTLARMLADDVPASARESGAIRAGADEELDAIYAAGSDARHFIATLEEAERQRTGIRSLRVGYNRVFGYYLEVPHAHSDRVPADYIRKQTLTGAERYFTALLKEHEATVLHAKERALAREIVLIAQCVSVVSAHAEELMRAARALATLDVIQSLADVADTEAWTCPVVDDSVSLAITAGRHPLVEGTVGHGHFVPNDCVLDEQGGRIVVLTGPNMAGKSTYLRQTAMIVLLAQVGSFVPAQKAHIGVCDRIFTRVGAHDDLAAGMSTFMVEMAETAAILHQATEKSLVILDEIGRGTSTYDGISIAQAVLEYLHDSPGLRCRSLFATHYHELTQLAQHLTHVRNARVEVLEEGEKVIFLHRIVDGGADRSYGIHVAQLAGIPQPVVVRARQLLVERETAVAGSADQLDLSLPTVTPAHPVVAELAGIRVDELTPLAALNVLARLRERVAE